MGEEHPSCETRYNVEENRRIDLSSESPNQPRHWLPIESIDFPSRRLCYFPSIQAIYLVMKMIGMLTDRKIRNGRLLL